MLRNDQAYAPIVAYILQNPLRAGLCATPSEYPYLGSIAFLGVGLVVSAKGRAAPAWGAPGRWVVVGPSGRG